jgi:glucose-6-phosphate 1-dehydrogenase
MPSHHATREGVHLRLYVRTLCTDNEPKDEANVSNPSASPEGASYWAKGSNLLIVSVMAGSDCGEGNGAHDFYKCDYRKHTLSILVVGASGDLAAKKTYPALLSLFRDGYLPETVVIVGYARSKKTDDELREKLASTLSPGGVKDKTIDKFLQRCFYRSGPYGDEDRLEEVYKDISKLEGESNSSGSKTVNRMFYFAVPPNVFADMGRALKAKAESQSGWNRYIIEKPFGRDTETFEELNAKLSHVLPEDSIYRIDHYLGKQSA